MKISTEFNKKINLPMRSLLGCGGAIAKRSVGIAVWGVGCDSEALRRNRCLGMWECDSVRGSVPEGTSAP